MRTTYIFFGDSGSDLRSPGEFHAKAQGCSYQHMPGALDTLGLNALADTIHYCTSSLSVFGIELYKNEDRRQLASLLRLKGLDVIFREVNTGTLKQLSALWNRRFGFLAICSWLLKNQEYEQPDMFCIETFTE